MSGADAHDASTRRRAPETSGAPGTHSAAGTEPPAGKPAAEPPAAKRSGVGLRRAPFVLLAGLGMLAGLDAALLLLGVRSPVSGGRLADAHGPLMVLGFVGTLIAEERAVALRRWMGHLAPALLGLGALSALSPAPAWLPGTLCAAGAAAMLATYAALFRRQPADAVMVQAVGAVCAVAAAVLWAVGAGLPVSAPWLAGFVVLTIVGERLELARVALPAGAEGLLLLCAALTMTGLLIGVLFPVAGAPVLGAGLLATVVWLVRFDVARRTLRSRGVTRFAAAAMLCAHAWLAVAGAIWLIAGPQTDGAGYDAVLHAVFLGFTISMIMGHAPIILPAVLHVKLPYHRAMWGPLALLHAGLLIRVMGDARGVVIAHQVGGVLDVVALLAFFVTAAVVAVTATLTGGKA